MNSVLKNFVEDCGYYPAPQWWKHLKNWKRVFWKSERQAHKKDIKDQTK